MAFSDEETAEMTLAILNGDEEAFNRFYDYYYDRLYRYLFVMSRYDRDLTRILMQDVMMRVVKYLKPIKSEKQLWNWLTRVTRTAYIDEYRRQQKRRGDVELPPEITKPEKIESHLAGALEEAMVELPDDDRKLIRKFYFEGESYKSLAVAIETTPKAIESKLMRIRKKLRTMITGIMSNG